MRDLEKIRTDINALPLGKDKLDLLAKTLIEREVLDVTEIRKLLNLPQESSAGADKPLSPA